MKKVLWIMPFVFLVASLQVYGSGAAQAQAPGPSAKVSKTGFPIVSEPITLKVLGRRAVVHGPWESMLVFSEYEKMTNVKIQWETVMDAGYREKLNLLLASGDLPDAIVRAGLSPSDVAKYGPQGVFMPLEGLVKDWGPNLNAHFKTYPEALNSSLAADGHMYALPAIVTLDAARTEKHWINKKWLDKLGMKVPENFEDFKKVLVAFRDKDPNGNGKADEIPMTARSFSNNGFGNIILNYVGSFGLNVQFGYWVTLENGKASV